MNNTIVRVKKLHKEAVVPSYAKYGDAGMDLTAVSKTETNHYIEYDTGLAVEIPHGYVGIIVPRSSVTKKQLMLKNSAGIIDSGYRGPIKVRFQDLGITEADMYKVGERIAQLIIMKLPTIDIMEVDELSDSERGEGGFGSSGN